VDRSADRAAVTGYVTDPLIIAEHALRLPPIIFDIASIVLDPPPIACGRSLGPPG
jgi:hypothetical protein